uniref:protein-tyrosine-phosphatase n=1 Tax=Parascaris univalens TaxID=6257 RepID=A0A915ASM2_PARUN
ETSLLRNEPITSDDKQLSLSDWRFSISPNERITMSRLEWNTSKPPAQILSLPSSIGSSSEVSSRILHDRPLNEFAVEKDVTNPSSLLNVYLPQASSPRFRQYIAKVVDISSNVEQAEKDVNRTFVASRPDLEVINIYGLHPGHQYSISVIGRRDGESELIKEESVIMDPIAPDFDSHNATVLSSHTNITLRALKPEKAIQDTFRISYVQIDPLKYFPKLDVHDIMEQRHIEIYLGNLSPGHDYNVSVTSLIKEIEGKPWTGILTTSPLSPQNVSVTELNVSCVQVAWSLPKRSGADRFSISYGPRKSDSRTNKLDVSSSETTADVCSNLQPGVTFVFTIIAQKRHETSEPSTVTYTLKPKPPENLRVVVDYPKRKFRMTMDVPSEVESKVDECQVSIVTEGFETADKKVGVEEARNSVLTRRCSLFVDLQPGRRYEVSAVTVSDGAASNKLAKGFALQPAFDMKAFGLSLQEENSGLQLEWPNNELTRARLADIWQNIVGNDSSLHMRVDPQSRTSRWKEQSKQFESRPSDNEPLFVPNLRMGSCYKVQIYTVTKSGIVSSQRFEELHRMSAPSVNITTDEIAKVTAAFCVAFDTEKNVDADECSVSLIVLDMHGASVYDRSLQLSTQPAHVLLDGLRPYHKYTINAQVKCGNSGERSCAPKMRTMEQVTFQTRQDRPGPVQNLTVRALNPYSVQLSWFPPALANGIIMHYIIGIHPMDEEDNDWSVNVGASPTHMDHTVDAIVDNFIGGLKYRMNVRAVTEAGEGDISAVSDAVIIEMPLLPPPRPTARIEILRNTVRSTGVTVRYSTAMFNTKHGLLRKYSLIVGEVTNNGRMNENWIFEHHNKTATWGQVQRFDLWPPYVAVESPVEPVRKFFPSRMISEVIGVDSTCEDIDAEVVCNGPLKPGAAYRFKLRMYTAPFLWTDSEYSEIVITEAAHSATTVGSVLIGLLVLFIASLLSAVVLFVWNKRNKSCPPTYGSAQSSKESQWAAVKMMMAERAADCLAKLGLDSQHAASSCTNAANDATPNGLTAPFGHHRRSRSLRERTGVDQRLERLPSGPPPGPKSFPYTVVPGTNTDKSRPVRVSDFAEHVRLMSADSDFRFSEEYDDLKSVGNGQTCIAADLTVNRAKNRFTNILPYDHSRVKLMPTDDEDGSDYVNASYIPGFNSRREFIAAQGPLPSTRDHFWRVVWEQQCPAIVALTKCVEKGRDKCHQYWPDNDQLSVLYADIEVTLMNETVYEEFMVRELRLTNMREPCTASRTMRHFHYMAWPDFGVPEHASGLVQFVRLFRQKLPPSSNNKPTIVHCSAGVGRSGTFIALDHLMQCMAIDRPLDVFGIVYEMRMERCHMVQNEQQYIFIHQCLLYVLESELGQANTQSNTSICSSNTNINAAFFASSSMHHGNLPNGLQSALSNPGNFVGNGSVIEHQVTSAWVTAPRIEVHQNPAFEDDEGIAESGL